MDQGNVIEFPKSTAPEMASQRITVQLTYQEGEVGYSIEGMSDSAENRKTVAVCLEAVARGLRRPGSNGRPPMGL